MRITRRYFELENGKTVTEKELNAVQKVMGEIPHKEVQYILEMSEEEFMEKAEKKEN